MTDPKVLAEIHANSEGDNDNAEISFLAGYHARDEVTQEKLDELRRMHKGWLDNPDASKGQREDSTSILMLLNEIDRLKDVFWKIRSKSHSWVITQDTAHIKKPIHDSYRTLANEGLNKYDK